jgi:hypothetical protein
MVVATWRHVLDIFEESTVTGQAATEEEGRTFVEAVRSAHRTEATLRFNANEEQQLLILTFRCYLEKEQDPFFEWIIRLAPEARVHGSQMTNHTLSVE